MAILRSSSRSAAPISSSSLSSTHRPIRSDKTNNIQKILSHFPKQILHKHANRRVTPLQNYEKRMIRSVLLTDNKFYWIKSILASLSLLGSRAFNVAFVYYAIIASIYELATMNAASDSAATGLKESTIWTLQTMDACIALFECIMVSVFTLLAASGMVEAFLKRGSTAPFYNWNRFWINCRRIGFSSFQFSFSLNLLFETMNRMIEFVVRLWEWADDVSLYMMQRGVSEAGEYWKDTILHEHHNKKEHSSDDEDKKENHQKVQSTIRNTPVSPSSPEGIPPAQPTPFLFSKASRTQQKRRLSAGRRLCQKLSRMLLRIVTIIPFVACSLILLVLLVAFGTAAVVVKLINIYQGALTANISDWSLGQYILILGFLNQLSAASSMGNNDREAFFSHIASIDMQLVNVVDQEEDEYGPYSRAEYSSESRGKHLQNLAIKYENIYIYSFLCACVGFLCGGWIIVLVAGISLGFYFLSGNDQALQLAHEVEVSPTLEKITRSMVWKRALFLTEFLSTLFLQVCESTLLMEMFKLMHIGDSSNFAKQLPSRIALDLVPKHSQLLQMELYDDTITAVLIEKYICVETGDILLDLRRQKKGYTYRREWHIMLTNPTSRAVLIQDFAPQHMKGCELTSSNGMGSGNPAYFDLVFLPPHTFHQIQFTLVPHSADAMAFLPKNVAIFTSDSQESFYAANTSNSQLRLHRWIFSQRLHILSIENRSKHACVPELMVYHTMNADVEYLIREQDAHLPPIQNVYSLVGDEHAHHRAYALISRTRPEGEEEAAVSDSLKDPAPMSYRFYFTCKSYSKEQ